MKFTSKLTLKAPRTTLALTLLAVLQAVIFTAGSAAAQSGLPPALYFHGPSWQATALGGDCLDAVPQPRADSSFSTGGSGNAIFETRHGSEPSTECEAFALPPKVRAGTRFFVYLNATLTSDYAQLEVILEVDEPVSTSPSVSPPARRATSTCRAATPTIF